MTAITVHRTATTAIGENGKMTKTEAIEVLAELRKAFSTSTGKGKYEKALIIAIDRLKSEEENGETDR